MKFLFIFLISSFLVPTYIFAHVLKTDASVGGVLHVDPSDDPVVGQEAQLFVEIKDRDGVFSWKDCQCQLEVKLQGESLGIQPMMEHGVSFIFPQKGLYQVVFSGSVPKFSLTFDVRVDQERLNTEPDPSFWQKLVQWIQSIFRR